MGARRLQRCYRSLAIVVLGVFLCTLLEASANHFFHDVLPESEVTFAAWLGLQGGRPVLRTPVLEPWEECPFNRLLSSLRSTSLLAPAAIRPVRCPPFRQPRETTHDPHTWIGFFSRARDPPGISLGRSSCGAPDKTLS